MLNKLIEMSFTYYLIESQQIQGPNNEYEIKFRSDISQNGKVMTVDKICAALP
jgi:hypothetical protein